MTVKLIQHDARLDAGAAGLGVNGHDIVEVLAAIDNDARTNGLARQAGAAAAGRDGHVHFAGDLHGDMDILDGSRDDNAQRLDSIDAGIGAVEPARGLIETYLALQMLAQVAGERFAFQLSEVHRNEPVPKKEIVPLAASPRGLSPF